MKKALLILCAISCSIGISFAQFKPQPFKWDIKYRGEINIGGAFSNKLHIPAQVDNEEYYNFAVYSSMSRPLIETVHGVSLSNYLYVGAGLGLQYYTGEIFGAEDIYSFRSKTTTWDMIAIPIFVNIKGFLPITDKLRPFTTLSFGGTAIANSNGKFIYDDTYYEDDYRVGNIYSHKIKGGFYCDWGVGIEYKLWSFTVGLQHQRYVQQDIDTDYYWDYNEWDYDYEICKEIDYDEYKTFSNSLYIKVGIKF